MLKTDDFFFYVNRAIFGFIRLCNGEKVGIGRCDQCLEGIRENVKKKLVYLDCKKKFPL